MNGQKLRITILGLNYAPEPTGNAPYTTSLAEGLAAEGHSVRVITGYPHYPEWQRRDGYTGWSKTEQIRGVEVVRLRHHIPRNPGAIGRLHMELSFGLRLFCAPWSKPDVVLVVSPALLSSALAILRARLTPSRPAAAIWVQDIYSRGVAETGGSDRAAWLAARVESLILKSTDGVVAIHERFRRHMVDSLSIPIDKVEVIRNWTHLPTSSPTVAAAATRVKLGWKDEDIVVLHAGNMGKKQGLENVVNAARLADGRNSRVRFVLMGDGNQRKTLEEQAKGIDHLEFIAPLPGDEFMSALSAADILLVNELPGVKDMAVPSKLTSYFNSGVPVIAATDETSVTATEITGSKGGVRVDAGDPAALLQAAEDLGNDKTSAERMGRNGLRYRHETLSEAVAIGHYDEFVSSLASVRGR